MLANATMAPRRRPEIELTYGGESLVVLALAFVVLRPKRMQLMLGHVGRAKARFDNPTEILNPNGLRELTRRPERRSRRCATFENDLRQEESEQRGIQRRKRNRHEKLNWLSTPASVICKEGKTAVGYSTTSHCPEERTSPPVTPTAR
jgi:hypothetical protein